MCILEISYTTPHYGAVLIVAGLFIAKEMQFVWIIRIRLDSFSSGSYRASGIAMQRRECNAKCATDFAS